MLNKSRVSFDSAVLKNLVNSKESCVIVRPSCKRNLELLPFHLSDLKASVKEILASRVTSYDIELGGLILGYKNVKVVNSLQLEDNGNINLDILADIYVFKPSIGSTLKGVVNKKGKDHVGCLVHGVFNAVVPRPHDRPGASPSPPPWPGSTASLGQELVLTVDKLDLTTSTLPYIRGQIVSLSCREEDIEGIDSGIGCGESVEGEESPRKKRKKEETEEMNKSEVEISLTPVSTANNHGQEESPSKKSKKKKKWKEDSEEKQTDLGTAGPRLDVNQGESPSLKKGKRKYKKDEVDPLQAETLEQEREITRNGKDNSSTSESEIIKSSLKGILKHQKNMECLRTRNKSDGDDSPRGSGKGEGEITTVKRRSKGLENSMSIVPYLFRKQTSSVSPTKTRKGEDVGDSPWGNEEDKGEDDGPTALQDAKSIISHMLEEKNTELSPVRMNRDVDVEDTPQTEKKRKKEKRKSREMEESRRSKLSHLFEEKIAELSPARMSKAVVIEESPSESKEEKKKKKEKKKSREMEETRRFELSHLIEEKIAELSPARMNKSMTIEESPSESKEEKKKKKEMRKSREMEETRRSESSHLLDEKASQVKISKGNNHAETLKSRKDKELNSSKSVEFKYTNSAISHLLEEKSSEMGLESSPVTAQETPETKKKKRKSNGGIKDSLISSLLESKLTEIETQIMTPEGSQQNVKTREDSVGHKEGRLDKEKTKDSQDFVLSKMLSVLSSEVGRKRKQSKHSDESSTDGMIDNILNSTRLSLETFLSPKDIPKTSKKHRKRASDVFSPEQILSSSNTGCNSSPQNIKRKSKGRDETFGSVLNSLGIEGNKKRKRLDSTDENIQIKKKRKSKGLDTSIEDLTKAMLASVANLN